MSHIFWWEGFIEVKQGLIKGPHSDLGSVEDSVESPWCKENLRIMRWRPKSSRTKMTEDDLVDVVGIQVCFHFVRYPPEAYSVPDECLDFQCWERGCRNSSG